MLTYGFFNSLNNDRKYNAEQMAYIIDALVNDGVMQNYGEYLAVKPGDGMSVVVEKGMAWFDSTWTRNDGQIVLDIDPADVTLARYDAVVLEVDRSVAVRANSIKVVKGTASSAPAKPTMVKSSNVNQYPLAYIKIEPGVTSISSSAIEIRVGQSDCPWITGILQTVPIDTLFNQWDGEFNTWFENLQAMLDDNVVTNLQSQIDALDTKVEGKADKSELAVPAKTVLDTRINKLTNVSSLEAPLFTPSAGLSTFQRNNKLTAYKRNDSLILFPTIVEGSSSSLKNIQLINVDTGSIYTTISGVSSSSLTNWGNINSYYKGRYIGQNTNIVDLANLKTLSGNSVNVNNFFVTKNYEVTANKSGTTVSIASRSINTTGSFTTRTTFSVPDNYQYNLYGIHDDCLVFGVYAGGSWGNGLVKIYKYDLASNQLTTNEINLGYQLGSDVRTVLDNNNYSWVVFRRYDNTVDWAIIKISLIDPTSSQIYKLTTGRKYRSTFNYIGTLENEMFFTWSDSKFHVVKFDTATGAVTHGSTDIDPFPYYAMTNKYTVDKLILQKVGDYVAIPYSTIMINPLTLISVQPYVIGSASITSVNSVYRLVFNGCEPSAGIPYLESGHQVLFTSDYGGVRGPIKNAILSNGGV